MTQSVWLVTGCSSGFGTQFVHSLVARGDKVIATGRNAETKLAHLKGSGAAILELDVSAPQHELDAKVAKAIGIYGHIDGLINNAGYVQAGCLEELTHQEWQDQLNTNLFGSMNMTRSLLPHFRSRKGGRIAFTSSIFSFSSVPFTGAYCVSKHGLAGYAQTLNDEVAAFGITTTLFDIGHFRTAVMGKAAKAAPKIEAYAPAWEDFGALVGSMDGTQPGDPKKGVERMIDVLKSEGMAKGRGVPLRIPIGSDACQMAREAAMASLKVCDDWAALSTSTDFDGPKLGFWAQQEAGN